MLSSRRVRLLSAQIFAGLALLAGWFVVVSFSDAQAGAGNGEKVRFTTIDGVEIQGMFYGGKRSSPTILMLHALGEDSRKKAWASLADTLNNKEGYAVLTFDFRGHGQSTTIEPALFWKYPRNIASVKGAPRKETIEYKDMKPDYYPVLANDIAAAKAFLDNRNDTGVCNTSSFIVLGPDTGATLGAIWLNAEYHRFAYTPPQFGVLPSIAKTSEGKDTIAAIWLSPTAKLGSRTVSLSSTLDVAGRENATPMVFIYSDNDNTGKTIAKACVSRFKGSSKKDDKYRFTVAMPIDGGGKLTGAALLQKSLRTEDNIVAYIKDVAEAKGNEWSERDFRKTQYVWRFPGVPQPLPAKLPSEKLLNYDTYDRFVGR